MADIVFIATALAFFVVCASYVRWCDRIIGTSDHTADQASEHAAEPAGQPSQDVTA